MKQIYKFVHYVGCEAEMISHGLCCSLSRKRLWPNFVEIHSLLVSKVAAPNKN